MSQKLKKMIHGHKNTIFSHIFKKKKNNQSDNAHIVRYIKGVLPQDESRSSVVGIGYFAISVLSYHLARRKNDVVSKTQRWQTWFRQRAVQWGERLPLVPICRKGFRRGPVFRVDRLFLGKSFLSCGTN